jgi:D-alanine-D-alanine ligase-like ATP-grasp enzyme
MRTIENDDSAGLPETLETARQPKVRPCIVSCMASTGVAQLQAREHYPYVARRLIRLFNEGVLTNVRSIDIEPEYGYVTRINYIDGSHRVTYGNDLGLNVGAACELAKDKGHTKFLLRTLGIACPKGAEFLLPHWSESIRQRPRQGIKKDIKTTEDADPYIQEHLGYPVYVKPVDGSKGARIFKVYNRSELLRVFSGYQQDRVRVALIEEPVEMQDYRIVVLDGELISAYRRVPFTVTGDGRSTIAQLVDTMRQRYLAEGRDTRVVADDPRMTQHLSRSGLALHSRLAQGEEVTLVPVSNLSVGGTSVDVCQDISSRWISLAAYVADNFNLRICGVDLACNNITDPESEYCVLEVNAAPGLDHYASSGATQQKIVDDLYTRVLNVCQIL